MTHGLRSWFDKAGPTGQSLTVLALVLAALALGLLIWRALRALRGKQAADALTVLAAAMASSVAATGMWHFFSRTMHLPTWIQAVLFAFMEISVLASALRARANVKRDGEAGADGLAVWVLTSVSGLMSASEAASPQEALVRLGAPLVAAWLWERSMVPERRAQKAAQGTAEAAVRWLFSVKRIAVRLGIATALGADLETEDANRRIDRFVRADNRAQRAGWLTRAHATRRRDRAHARLMEQARMQADPRALYSHLGRQAILDVLARLGGDDAVIDRERARQMQHILADAVAGSPQTPAAPVADAAETGATDRQQAAGAHNGTPAGPDNASAPVAPTEPVMAPAPAAFEPTILQVPVPTGFIDVAAAHETPVTPVAAQHTVRQDELPLHLPQQPQQPAHPAPPAQPAQPLQPVAAANGAPAGFHIPAARHSARSAPANSQPYNSGTVTASIPANGNGVPRTPATPPARQRERIPVAPVQFVAAPLPEPEPEPEPAYNYAAYEPEPEPQPEPAAPRPPMAVHAPLLDQRLADRITKAMAAANTPPNPLKLANELGISPALMHDTIEALGGFNALWSRVRQDQDAEGNEPDLAFDIA